MAWYAVFLFAIVVHIRGIEASRYDVDDAAGIVSIALLVLAIIVCIISLIMFFYIVYKLWNGDFDRHHYYTPRTSNLHVSREKMVMEEEYIDGREDTTKITSFHNHVAAAEEAREAEFTVVETTAVEENLREDEVIVRQAPPTDQAEMETQELVVVFDDNDDVVDVLTHVT